MLVTSRAKSHKRRLEEYYRTEAIGKMKPLRAAIGVRYASAEGFYLLLYLGYLLLSGECSILNRYTRVP